MFRNRGELPNINTNVGDSNDNGGYSAPHYSRYWNGRFFIIYYDKTFVAIELIATFIILLIVLAVYLFAYQVSFEDPIAQIKETFLTTQLISIGISLVATVLTTFLTKSSKEHLIKNLRVIAIASILMIILFFGIKLYMDNQYNEDTFGKFYEQYEYTSNHGENSSKISLGLSGIKISNLKEAYIEESVNAYTNFSIKAMLYRIIHVLVVMIIFYLSYRLSVIEGKKERLAKDDAILYDKEENVKF